MLDLGRYTTKHHAIIVRKVIWTSYGKERRCDYYDFDGELVRTRWVREYEFAQIVGDSSPVDRLKGEC